MSFSSLAIKLFVGLTLLGIGLAYLYRMFLTIREEFKPKKPKGDNHGKVIDMQ